MRRTVLILPCALCMAHCLAVPAPAAAQVNQPILEVRVEQEGDVVSDPAVLALVETKTGESLSMREVRETTTHLMGLRRYEDVQTYAVAAANGVRLRYVLVPQHPVDRMEFRGDLGLPEDDLRRAVVERFGATPAAGRSGEVDRLLEAYYRSRGFPQAQVGVTIQERHRPDRATMIVRAASGTRVLIEDVRFEQVDAGERATVVPPDVRKGQPYDEPEIERELEKWVATMHEAGFYEAFAIQRPLFPPGGAVVIVNLASGPRVVVAFTGDALPEDERARLVPIRAEGSADEDLLEDAKRNIEQYLFARGYRAAVVNYTPVERDGVLTITFDVRRGPRHVLAELDIGGNRGIPTAELRPLFALKEGDIFVQSSIGTGAAAVGALYRERGFPRVEVKASDATLPPERPDDPDRRVVATVAIAEGPRTLVRSVSFQDATAFPETQLRSFVTVAPDRPYSSAAVAASRDRIELEYRNRGYSGVVVTPQVTPAEGDTRADITFRVSEGAQAIVDQIIVAGNERTSAETITRELLLRPGEPLGEAALIESRARVQALGLFSGVNIEAIEHAGEARRDVLVQVRESPATTVDFGAGLEGANRLRSDDAGQAEERFELAPRGLLGITRRNLWGKNREASLYTRISLRSTDARFDADGNPLPASEEGGTGFNEYRVVGTFREPRVFNTRADLLLTGFVDQAVRSSFNFSRREARAEIGMRVARWVSVAGLYSFQRTKLFDEKFNPDDKPLIDRLFPQVRLSKFAGSLIHDSRDDALDAAKGGLAILNTDLAMRAIGSEVGFVKTYLQGFSYHRLPGARRMVAAFGARVGAAHGFGREVETDTGGVIGTEVLRDLPASERFFAGGENTVRGFSLDRLGNDETISPSGFPTGGNSVIILNAEMRVALFGSVQGVGFVDAGNVFPRASDLTLTDLRPAAGVGLRYNSRFGPIRVDLGFNLDPRELVPGTLERKTVLHISLGQAF